MKIAYFCKKACRVPPVEKMGGRRPAASPPHYTADGCTVVQLTYNMNRLSADHERGSVTIARRRVPMYHIANKVDDELVLELDDDDDDDDDTTSPASSSKRPRGDDDKQPAPPATDPCRAAAASGLAAL